MINRNVTFIIQKTTLGCSSLRGFTLKALFIERICLAELFHRPLDFGYGTLAV